MDSWPFADDFDWAVLPSDPLPAPWVLPWCWLRDLRDRKDWPRFAEYVALMEERGTPMQFGYRAISAPSVKRLPVPLDMIVEEMIAQSILFDHGGQWYRLTTGEPTASPLTQPVAFASGESGLSVGAVEAHARWTDSLSVVSVAHAADPVFVVWVGDRLQVRTPDALLHEVPARLTRAVRTCPLIPDSKPGQLCRQYGGGWVSRAMVASGRWLDEREKRLREVGCDTCGNGEIRVPPKYGEYILVGPTRRAYGSQGPTRFLHPMPGD